MSYPNLGEKKIYIEVDIFVGSVLETVKLKSYLKLAFLKK